jgi:hypothetical protein
VNHAPADEHVAFVLREDVRPGALVWAAVISGPMYATERLYLLPAFVYPGDDELAMRAYVSGTPTDLDPDQHRCD